MQFNDKDTAGFATIDNVIANVLSDLNMTERYSEMAETIGQHVIRGIRFMNMYAVTDIRVTYLRVNEMNIVNLPDDYIDYRKIGIVWRGQVWTLTLNENIALPRAIRCGEEIRTVINSGIAEDFTSLYGGAYFPSHYYNGTYVSALYGMGGGFNTAYYRIDKEYKRIIFDGVIPKCEIVLEYQSSGVSLSGQTIIPCQIVEPLIAWCHWKMSMFDPKLTRGQIADRKETFMEFYGAMEFKEKMLTYDEFVDTLYASSKQTPKR